LRTKLNVKKAGSCWFSSLSAPSPSAPSAGADPADYPMTLFPSGQASPFSIAPGPDGALWFTEVNEQTGDRVARMTTDGTVTDELPIVTPEVDCSPTGITAGPDGNVWFTCELAGQIGRITVPKPVPPGPAPVPVAVTAEPRFAG
jgi:virginiamycin B lyase